MSAAGRDEAGRGAAGRDAAGRDAAAAGAAVAEEAPLPARVAVLDDKARMAEVLAMVLRKDGHDVVPFERPQALLDALAEAPFDLVLTDLKMPGMSGIEVLAHIRSGHPEVAVILMTAYATVETAVEAMKRGALDYLEKPIDNRRCRHVVGRVLERNRLARENRVMREALRARFGTAAIIAESRSMQQVLDLVQRAARSNASVLISGESGTGKEVIARAIHFHSRRVGGPFVAVNCKAFAAGVLESELFGHEKGAFTGAAAARAGVFERAHGGTLFLDEIGEVNADFQAKLLRVLQEREVQRVGGDRVRPVDVRVVCATNRDLRAAMADGSFREDLFFRLAVIPIALAPLRERRADIVPLARAFVTRMAREQGRALSGWSDEVAQYLLSHDWPGNVRELENTIERGVVLARGEQIELSDIVLDAPAATAEGTRTLQQHLDAAAEAKIRQVLDEVSGVRIDAAKRLGIERTTLYRLMKRFGI